MKPNINRGKIHHEEPVRTKNTKGISKQAIKMLLMCKSMNKVIEAIINGNNVQKMKLSSQPMVVCVCVC